MSKIIVRNSCIKIEDYTFGDCPQLENNFYIFDPITHRKQTFGMFYDNENRCLYIPRGLDIWKIKQYLDTQVIYKEKPNDFAELDNIMLKLKPRDEQQKEALRFMVGANEYSDNLDEPQISVNLNTGKGKTYCSIATICYLKAKSIIITASVTLLNQWKGNIIDYTNLSSKDILLLDTQAMNLLLLGKSISTTKAKLYLCTHATLHSFGTTFGWNNLNKVFELLGIGIKIFDEAHTNYENMLMIDFFTNVAKTYYVTATPARSNYMEDEIFQLSMKNVPGIDLFDAVNDPHTEYIAIKFNSKPTAQQISMCKNAYGLDRNKYVNYVTKQPNFYLMMRIVMDLVMKANGRALLYIGTNEGLLRVYKWIGENYPHFIGHIGIFTSLVPKEQKFKEKEKKLILSTTKSAGLGEHIEGLKLTVVLAEPFKSEVITRQTLGRTRDKNTVYVELVDLGFRKIRDYYYFKRPIFNKYASGTSDMTIDQYELENRAHKLAQENRNVLSPIYLYDTRFFEYEIEVHNKVRPAIYKI